MSLSIITVHRNDFAGLERTMESMERFQSSSCEWIVIDGNSRIPGAHEASIRASVEQSADTFVSEPDRGIYDAMNKGLGHVTGDYFLFLNAGDRFHEDFDIEALNQALGDARPDMIWGKTCMEYPDGSFGIKKFRGPDWAWYGMPVCHQSVLFSRTYFASHEYDTRMKVAADYELISREMNNGASVFRFDSVISIHAAGGLSQQDKSLSLSEEHTVRIQHHRVPGWLSRIITGFRHLLWNVSDASPAFNRLWRKRL